jgi:hypothetical protein
MQDWLSPLTPPKAACHSNFHESGLCDVHTGCQARVVLIESFGSLHHSNGNLHWENGCVVNPVRLCASVLTRKILVTSDFLLPARLDHAGIRGHEGLPGVAWQVSSAHNL